MQSQTKGNGREIIKIALEKFNKMEQAPFGIQNENFSETGEKLEFIKNFVTTGEVFQLYDIMKEKGFEIKTLTLWMSKLTNLDFSSINQPALTSKIHRQWKDIKTKRKRDKFNLLQRIFHIPTVTISCAPMDTTSDVGSGERSAPVQLAHQLHERREKVKELTESKKQLKRKLVRIKEKQGKSTDKINTLESEVKEKVHDLKITK